MPRRHSERHRTQRIGWLRAAVLGANDGIVSTASLIVGVAAAHAPRGDVLVAGVAGLVAGAMPMAAGEYKPTPRRPTWRASVPSSLRTETTSRRSSHRSTWRVAWIRRWPNRSPSD